MCNVVEMLRNASVSTSTHVDGLCSGIIEMAEAYGTIAGQLGHSDSATLISDVQKLVEFSYHFKSLGNALKKQLGDLQANAKQQMEINKEAMQKREVAAVSENDRQKSSSSLMRLNKTAILFSQVKRLKKLWPAPPRRAGKAIWKPIKQI